MQIKDDNDDDDDDGDDGVINIWMFMQPISIVRMRRVTFVGQVLPDNDKQV